MKTLQAIYKNGHLWDKSTGNRILIRDGVETVVTVGSDHDLLARDPGNLESVYRSRLEIEQELIQKCKDKQIVAFKQVRQAGDKLYFTISTKVNRDIGVAKQITKRFEVVLMEDLFVVQKQSGDRKGEVYNCHCIVETHTDPEFVFFEKVHAYSLNDAYSKTYVVYFTIYGKATANIYKRFFLSENQTDTLESLRYFEEDTINLGY